MCCCLASDLPKVAAMAAPLPFVLAVAVAASRSGSVSPPPQQQKPADMRLRGRVLVRRATNADSLLCDLAQSLAHSSSIHWRACRGTAPLYDPRRSGARGGLFEWSLTCSMNTPPGKSQSAEKEKGLLSFPLRSLSSRKADTHDGDRNPSRSPFKTFPMRVPPRYVRRDATWFGRARHHSFRLGATNL